MIYQAAIQFVFQIFVSGIDKWRIATATKKKKDNIDHRVSVAIAIAGCAIQGLVSIKDWSPLWLAEFALLVTGMRLLFYEILLNNFRGKAWNYQDSVKTSSWVDKHFSFYTQRWAGFMLLALFIAAQIFIK